MTITDLAYDPTLHALTWTMTDYHAVVAEDDDRWDAHAADVLALARALADHVLRGPVDVAKALVATLDVTNVDPDAYDLVTDGAPVLDERMENVAGDRWRLPLATLGDDASARALRQRRLCARSGLPLFAPPSGACYRCGRNVYERLDGASLVTGCPFCHRTFCD